jgi:hypothetical protein
MSIHSIYNVASDLRQHGYTRKIDANSPKSHPPPHHSPAHQESTPSEASVRSVGDVHQESPSSGELETGEKYFPGEAPQSGVPPPGRTRRPPQGYPPSPHNLPKGTYRGHHPGQSSESSPAGGHPLG